MQVDGYFLGTLFATNTVVEARWQPLGCRAHTLALAELELHVSAVVALPGPELHKIAC